MYGKRSAWKYHSAAEAKAPAYECAANGTKNTIINQGNVPSGPEQTFEDSKHRVRGGGPVMPVEAAPAKKRGGSDLPAAQRNRTRQRLLKITPYWE